MQWRKPEYPEETTALRQVTDETFHTYDCNQRCWMDNHRVGQSISTSCVGSNPYLHTFGLPYGGGGLGFGTMVGRQACKPKVGVCVGSNPLEDSGPPSLPSCGPRLESEYLT